MPNRLDRRDTYSSNLRSRSIGVLFCSYVQYMAITTRDKKGRAVAAYLPEELYKLVRNIAKAVKPEDPEALTFKEFDKARLTFKTDDETPKGKIPSARAICKRLADRDGQPMSWERVKRVALDETASFDHRERRRQAAAPADYLSDRAIYFALRMIAKRLGVKTLQPGQYEDERRVAIKEERQRDVPRPLLAQLLPTEGQIETHCVTETGEVEAAWDEAIRIAELEPRAQRKATGRKPRSLPLAEAIHLFVQSNDELPSHARLDKFAELADFQFESRSKKWREHLQDAIAYRKTLGFEEPTAMPKSPIAPGGNPGKPDVKAPAPGSIPGVMRRQRKGQAQYTRLELVTAIQTYLEQLDGDRPTQKGYGRFAAKKQLPSASNFRHHGGWTALLKEARRGA